MVAWKAVVQEGRTEWVVIFAAWEQVMEVMEAMLASGTEEEKMKEEMEENVQTATMTMRMQGTRNRHGVGLSWGARRSASPYTTPGTVSRHLYRMSSTCKLSYGSARIHVPVGTTERSKEAKALKVMRVATEVRVKMARLVVVAVEV